MLPGVWSLRTRGFDQVRLSATGHLPVVPKCHPSLEELTSQLDVIKE